VIVDADRYGVNLVRELRAVFPATAVVALSKSPVTRTVLAREGATAVSPTIPPQKLTALIRALVNG
jgi:hypothetical protein